jgi:thioredoxin-dependent peroxiredoxin
MSLRSVIVLVLLLPVLAGGCGARMRPDGGRGLLPVGAPAPEVSAVDQEGHRHALAEARGQLVVVYFYPKDGTPGCTREACAFRDVWERFRAAGIAVLGVSGDDQASHVRFARTHRLPFPLLVDADHTWAAAFGVPVHLGMDSRVSFLIGRDGRVAKVYPDVDPGVHATRILTDADALRGKLGAAAGG